MAIVFDNSKYPLIEESSFSDTPEYEYDEMSDGTLVARQVRLSNYRTISCSFQPMLLSEADQLAAYIRNNIAVEFDLPYGDQVYRGKFIGGVSTQPYQGLFLPSVRFYGYLFSDAQNILIVKQPENIQFAAEGSNVSFTGNAIGGDVNYQWQVYESDLWQDIDGGAYSGENTATLNLLSVDSAMAGVPHRLAFSNASGTEYSEVVSVLNVGSFLVWEGASAKLATTWATSGHGDVIDGSITPFAVSASDQFLYSSGDGKHYLKVAATTGNLIAGYVDSDGTTQRTITGPALTDLETAPYVITHSANQVSLVVGGVSYVGTDAPSASQPAIEYLAADDSEANNFNGVFSAKFNNDTKIQGDDLVEHDGSTILVTIPEVRLSTHTLTIDYLHGGDSVIFTGSVPILSVSSNSLVTGANASSLMVDGVAYASQSLNVGQHYTLSVYVDDGTLTQVGILHTDSKVAGLNIDSGTFTYDYPLTKNADDATKAENTDPVTKNRIFLTNLQTSSNNLEGLVYTPPAARENVAFFSGGESGSIDWDGSDFGDDSWQSSQAWGEDGSSSVANGTEQVFVESAITRHGGSSRAIRVVLREIDGQRGGKWRNELRAPPGRDILYGDTVRTGFSIYLPNTTDNQSAVAGTQQNQSFAQWHWRGDSGSDHLHVYGGDWKLKIEESGEVFTGREATLGVWHDFEFIMKPHTSSGKFEVWHQNDGGGYVQISDYSGRTVSSSAVTWYAKIGIYFYAAMTGFGTIQAIYDEYRMSEPNLGTSADVRPGE